MHTSLEDYYEAELAAIRKLAAEFARGRPKIADRLALDKSSGDSEDPHVERLLEAFSFLTARIRHKIDDDLPEVVNGLLGVLYPHYLAPIPSMAIAEMRLDPSQGKIQKGYPIPSGVPMTSREISGVKCRFRSAYPITLWPLEVRSAHFQNAPFGPDVRPPQDSQSHIRIVLQGFDSCRLSQLSLDTLRFHIAGGEQVAYRLYDLLFSKLVGIQFSAGSEEKRQRVNQTHSQLKEVGFAQDEGLLPYSKRSFIGYRLLTEYFSFPAKFLFFDLVDLQSLLPRLGPDDNELTIDLFFNQEDDDLENSVSRDSFRLGCTPIVNLFEKSAEPIHLRHDRPEYRVVPDSRNTNAMEVYTIDSVVSKDVQTGEQYPYEPHFFPGRSHHREAGKRFWSSQRRASIRKDDEGSEVFLTLVDTELDTTRPTSQIVLVKTTCSNRNLPGELRMAGGQTWQFFLDSQAPVKSILPVVNPTPRLHPEEGSSLWRLVSHLCLNHLSISGGEDGAATLREMLELYDFSKTKVTREQLRGLTSLTAKSGVKPIRVGQTMSLCRGTDIQLEVAPERFTGHSLILFTQVLSHFLGLYASINSYSRLKVSTVGGLKVKDWPARAGDRPLL